MIKRHSVSKPYLIFGLPRSRTTWLSNALTHANSFCQHDILPEFGFDPERVKSVLQSGLYPFMGIADTGLVFHADRFAKVFAGVPALVIMREPAEVFAGLERLQIPPDLKLKVQMAMDPNTLKNAFTILDNLSLTWAGPLLKIKYSDLDENGSLIWRHLIGDEHFDQRRWDMLCDYKVTVFEEREFQRMKTQGFR